MYKLLMYYLRFNFASACKKTILEFGSINEILFDGEVLIFWIKVILVKENMMKVKNRIEKKEG